LVDTLLARGLFMALQFPCVGFPQADYVDEVAAWREDQNVQPVPNVPRGEKSRAVSNEIPRSCRFLADCNGS